MHITLTIAGSDPTGGAGIQADLKTFKAMGVYGISVISAVTRQNTEGVQDIYCLPSDFFASQLDSILSDIRPDALKTGMLYTPDTVRNVAEKIKAYSLKNLVVDPVMASSTGVSLMQEKTLEEIRCNLFPFARVITPNISEASFITGMNIQSEEDMKKAAIRLKESGAEAVVVTGGHFKGSALDVLFDGKDILSLASDKFEGEYHGTGCVFSSVITACLALGYDAREAFMRAKEFVAEAIKSAVSVGKGMKILNV